MALDVLKEFLNDDFSDIIIEDPNSYSRQIIEKEGFVRKKKKPKALMEGYIVIWKITRVSGDNTSI